MLLGVILLLQQCTHRKSNHFIVTMQSQLHPSSNNSTARSTLLSLLPKRATARSLVKSGNILIKLSTSLSLAPSISGLSVRPEIISIKFRASGSACCCCCCCCVGGCTTVSLDRGPVC